MNTLMNTDMNIRVKTSLAALLLLLAVPALCSAQADTLRVLWVGNSYTYFHDLPTLVEGLAAEQGQPVAVTSVLKGGERFRGHLQNPRLTDLLARGGWDYVVLQEQSSLPSGPTDGVAREVYPYARQLDSLAHAASPDVRVVYYMTWGHRNGCIYDMWGDYPLYKTYEGMQVRLTTSYIEMAYATGALCAPVGMAWQTTCAERPDIDLYEPDNFHPSLAGSWLAANAITATLLGRTFEPARLPALDAADARYLSSAAMRAWTTLSTTLSSNLLTTKSQTK